MVVCDEGLVLDVVHLELGDGHVLIHAHAMGPQRYRVVLGYVVYGQDMQVIARVPQTSEPFDIPNMRDVDSLCLNIRWRVDCVNHDHHPRLNTRVSNA